MPQDACCRAPFQNTKDAPPMYIKSFASKTLQNTKRLVRTRLTPCQVRELRVHRHTKDLRPKSQVSEYTFQTAVLVEHNHNVSQALTLHTKPRHKLTKAPALQYIGKT